MLKAEARGISFETVPPSKAEIKHFSVVGRHFRNVIENAAKQRGQRVVVDFKGIDIVSSSYADELIGSLFADYGFVGFTERFRLANLNETNSLIINEALIARIKKL